MYVAFWSVCSCNCPGGLLIDRYICIHACMLEAQPAGSALHGGFHSSFFAGAATIGSTVTVREGPIDPFTVDRTFATYVGGTV